MIEINDVADKHHTFLFLYFFTYMRKIDVIGLRVVLQLFLFLAWRKFHKRLECFFFVSLTHFTLMVKTFSNVFKGYKNKALVWNGSEKTFSQAHQYQGDR